jgi:Ca2+-transporting ATPase
MPVKSMHIKNIQGMDETDVSSLQKKFGKNIFYSEPTRRLIQILFDIFREPMFILLFSACILYFILSKPGEGMMMIVAMVFVAGVSVYQEVRSSRALEALKHFTEPKVIVIRNGKEKTIATDELVPGDIIILSEGNKIPADAVILRDNDLTVNESIITGESLPVEKNEAEGNNLLYQGATVNSGQCYAKITATGNNTVLGKLGKAVSSYTTSKTLLQQQVGGFVKKFAFFGFGAFVIILFVNYIKSDNLISSLLFALTLAMAVIPEEIPVAFSSFMALGAYHMARLGIISRQPQIIENLGAVTVICLDKTGTITENRMQVKIIYDYETDKLLDLEKIKKVVDGNVLRYGVLASEEHPFDAMEKAIWEAYEKNEVDNLRRSLKLIYEYPLQGQPPMMTHVYQDENLKIAAAKGAAERILKICKLDNESEQKITARIKFLAAKGYRVIGIASAVHSDEPFPDDQDDFNWTFEGLLSLYDPPKKNISIIFRQFYDAKIAVKLITGDYPETTINIAEQVGMFGYLKYLTGNEVIKMKENELQEAVKRVNIFARMFPEAKLKVIEALKANREIVAMTGDGVNDAPALKSAHIGIAMGEKGTEIARQASDLVITNDNLEKMVEAIEQGRKIFSNLKKAVRYIISIHIPIIFTAALPLLLGWKYPNIFTPIHIIFLELIMGPTCSIFFEREPVEKDILKLPPRDRSEGLFRNDELLISIVQGLIIAAGILILYYIFMNNGNTLSETRTIVFTALIISNIFLTFVNRSFTKTITKTIRYKNNLALPVIIISSLFLCAIILVPFVRNLFELSAISANNFFVSLATAFISVAWFEIYKMGLNKSSLNNNI